MTQYIIRRLLAAIPVVFGVLFVTFALARSIPGDPCTAYLGEKATEAICDQFFHDKGLDQPIAVQFGIYLRDILQGDLGESIRLKQPVTQILIQRLPVTVELGMTALFLALLLGIPLGIISAVRRNSPIDVATMVGANIGVSMPVFWLGLMLQYLFALRLKDTILSLEPTGRLSPGVRVTPFYQFYEMELAEAGLSRSLMEFLSNFYVFNSIITGQWEVLGNALAHLVLPAVALSTISMAVIARMTRSSMLEVLGLDYIRTARAKGLDRYTVVVKHAFRNALLPIVTIAGLQLGLVLSGAILTESVFGLSGAGRTLYEAITARDYPIIQGFVVVISVGYVFINLLIDLSYAYLDPRIRLN